MKRKTPDQWFALSVVVLILMFFAFSFLTSCVVGPDGKVDPKATAANVSTSLTAIAPLIPGPWGGVAAGAAGIVTLLGGLFAGRARSNAMDAGPDAVAALNPMVKVLAERKWLFPTVGAVVALGNAAGVWHIDLEKLWTLLSALGIPAGMEFAKDIMAKPAPTTAPPTQ